MAHQEHVFNLAKAAKKEGGDRYESSQGFVIYFPQSISRMNGQPVQSIIATFTRER